MYPMIKAPLAGRRVQRFLPDAISVVEGGVSFPRSWEDTAGHPAYA